jgi:hypothetical protein
MQPPLKLRSAAYFVPVTAQQPATTRGLISLLTRGKVIGLDGRDERIGADKLLRGQGMKGACDQL